MRPLRPFCGTVSKAQLLSLLGTIKASAPGAVTTQLSPVPPASSSATDVRGSSESRPATVQPPEPPPTTTKSNVSVTRVPPIVNSSLRAQRSNPSVRAKSMDCVAALATTVSRSRQEPQQFLQPRDLRAIGRIEIGEPVEWRAIEYRLLLGQRPKSPFAVIGPGAGRPPPPPRRGVL